MKILAVLAFAAIVSYTGLTGSQSAKSNLESRQDKIEQAIEGAQ